MRLSEISNTFSGPVPPGFKRDNPGGAWLKQKQEDAEWDSRNGRGPVAWNMLNGTTTARVDDLLLPVSFLRTVRGAKDEKRRPGDVNYDSLMKKVEKNGWNPDFPIMLFINHIGIPFLWEGNTRVAVAFEKDIPAIRAEVQWLNGGEDMPGRASPANLAKLHQEALQLAAKKR